MNRCAYAVTLWWLASCASDMTLRDVPDHGDHGEPDPVEPPPVHLRCYGMNVDPERSSGLQVELQDYDADRARYDPGWTHTVYWVECPRPAIDYGEARCPTSLSDRQVHWVDCFVEAPDVA